MVYSKAFWLNFGSSKISLQNDDEKPWAIVRHFPQKLAILKFLIKGSGSVHWVLLNISPTTMVYSKAFLSSFGSSKISLQNDEKPWAIVRHFPQKRAILKFLIKGSGSVHWVLLNISPTTMVYSKALHSPPPYSLYSQSINQPERGRERREG